MITSDAVSADNRLLTTQLPSYHNPKYPDSQEANYVLKRLLEKSLTGRKLVGGCEGLSALIRHSSKAGLAAGILLLDSDRNHHSRQIVSERVYLWRPRVLVESRKKQQEQKTLQSKISPT